MEALKCIETYGTPNFERVGCLNCTKFLNYKNEAVKYNLCSSRQCAIRVDALFYQREPGEFLCECKPLVSKVGKIVRLFLFDSHTKAKLVVSKPLHTFRA